MSLLWASFGRLGASLLVFVLSRLITRWEKKHSLLEPTSEFLLTEVLEPWLKYKVGKLNSYLDAGTRAVPVVKAVSTDTVKLVVPKGPTKIAKPKTKVQRST